MITKCSVVALRKELQPTSGKVHRHFNDTYLAGPCLITMLHAQSLVQ